MLTIPPAVDKCPDRVLRHRCSAAKYLTDNAPSNYRRVIVVLSDGDDNFSEQIRRLSELRTNASL